MGTLLEEIAKRIKDHDDSEKEEMKKVRPTHLFLTEYVVPPFVIKETRDKKRIDQLRKVLTFIKKKAQPNRKKGVCTIMPISSTSKDLKKIWTNVFRGRELMEEIGLIRIYSDEYNRFGRRTFAKLYMYFYENELKFINYCEKNNISELDLDLKEKENDEIVESDEINEDDEIDDVLDETKVKIGKGLYLKKPASISCSEFEKQLLEIFKTNYPEYQKYKNMVDEMNEKYYKDKPEFAIRFEPSFQWNKSFTKVMKIGFRATNERCNKRKDERDEILDDNNLVLDSDVNASVPRLNSSMNLGHWDNNERDMYEIIFHNCYPNEVFTSSAREAMKQLLWV